MDEGYFYLVYKENNRVMINRSDGHRTEYKGDQFENCEAACQRLRDDGHQVQFLTEFMRGRQDGYS